MTVVKLIALLQAQEPEAIVYAFDADAADVVPVTGVLFDEHEVVIQTARSFWQLILERLDG